MTALDIDESDRIDRWWRVVAGPGVVLVFAALTVPLVIGIIDTRLYTPLALPGYTLFVVLTVVGERLLPQYSLRLYWIPFALCCYGIAIVLAGIGRACLRDRT